MVFLAVVWRVDECDALDSDLRCLRRCCAAPRPLCRARLARHSVPLHCAVLALPLWSCSQWCRTARRSRRCLDPDPASPLRTALPSLLPPPPMSDLTPVLILVAAGFAALFLLLKRNDGAAHAQPQPMPMQMQMPPAWMMQPPQPPPQMQQQSVPSAELRAMQDTLKMLVEAQARTAQTQQQQQRSYGSSSSSSSAASLANNRMRTSSDDDDSGAPTPDLAARLNRTPSSSAAAATAVPAVPFELLQDMKALQDSIKNLERKNRELNRQLTLTEVSNVVDVERKYRLPIPVLNPDSGASAVQGIQQLNLSASEIETIRAIFNMFDVHQTGQISTKELSALHKQLGEPLTDDEANAAVSELDQEGTGRSVHDRATSACNGLRSNRGVARSSLPALSVLSVRAA